MFRNLLILMLALAGVGVALAALWAYSIFRTNTPEEKLEALRKEVKPKGGEVFQTVLMGKPVAFLLLNCSVFRLDTSGRKVKRNKVLSPGFYLWFAACTEQSIKAEGEFVKVYLANRALGAGGGNTSGGNYRSKDGVLWEKEMNQGWMAIKDAQP